MIDPTTRRLHDDAVVVDAHSDVFCDVTRRRLLGETEVLARLHVPAWREAGVDVVVTTLFTEEEQTPPEGYLDNMGDRPERGERRFDRDRGDRDDDREEHRRIECYQSGFQFSFKYWSISAGSKDPSDIMPIERGNRYWSLWST